MNTINLDSLSTEQLNAVKTTEGPVLVLAGAGSGKTRVLTLRISYIAETLNIKPYNILAVTFTNKAANEIKERMQAYLGDSTRQLWTGTFHKICIRILREHLGSFSIYDEYDQAKAIKEIVGSLGLDPKKYVAKNVLPKISKAKEQLVMPDEYVDKIGGRDAAAISRIYKEYYSFLRRNNAYDFDDLIFFAVKLLQDNSEIRERYQKKFKYIHVDEYQDINYSQYILISILAEKWKNIFCVGDDDQSIYGWRGADVSIILRFEEDYPNCKIFKLGKNYRSTGTIVKAAAEVIKHNTERNTKDICTDNDDGAKLTLINAADGENEANQVCAEINKSRSRNNASYGEYAILYRANHMSRIFEKILVKNGMPYKIIGGTRFYEREEIKDMIAYLKAVNNPMDDISLLRIINKPHRSIGDVCVSKLQALAKQYGVSVFESFRYLENSADFSERQKTNITKFALLMRGFIKDNETCPVGELVKNIFEKSGIKESLEASAIKGDESLAVSRKENIGEFINNAVEYSREFENPNLADFLEQVSLSADIDSFDDNADAIALMTVHSAKGLEFPYVYIIGLEEGIFPHERSLGDSSQVEEERRLMYVAMTRAMKELTLSYADYRMNNGEARRREKSSFLKHIPRELFAGAKGEAAHSSVSLADIKNKLAEREIKGRKEKTYRPGTRILHPSFGKGIVINCQGEGSHEVVTIMFENRSYGLKKLLVQAIKMTVLK